MALRVRRHLCFSWALDLCFEVSKVIYVIFIFSIHSTHDCKPVEAQFSSGVHTFYQCVVCITDGFCGLLF